MHVEDAGNGIRKASIDNEDIIMNIGNTNEKKKRNKKRKNPHTNGNAEQ